MFVIRFIFTILHCFVLLLLTATLLNDYIAPQTFGWLNLLSLGFPILVIVYMLLCIFWVISFKKRGFIFLLALVLFLTPIRRWINFSSPPKANPNLKVLSFNIKNNELNKKASEEYLNSLKHDVLMLQESGSSEADKPQIPEFPYVVHYPIVSIYSKHKITGQGRVLNDINNGHALYADIEINGKIIRFFNIYLEPFYLKKSMVKPSKNLDVNEEKAKNLAKRLIPTFKIHQEQVEKIRHFISNSPYPVILGGDFNAVPNSYEYYQLSQNLHDAFLEVGNGSGTSFHDYKFPIRIDYLFSSKEIKPINYSINRNIKTSDHFPVSASFLIQ